MPNFKLLYLFSSRKADNYDTQIEIRRVSSLLAKKRYKNRPQKKFGHLQVSGSSKTARARSAIFQTQELKIALSGKVLLGSHATRNRTWHLLQSCRIVIHNNVSPLLWSRSAMKLNRISRRVIRPAVS